MYVSILFITTLENISLIQRAVKFSLCLAFMSFVFIRLPLLCHVTSVFEVSSKGPPPLVSLYVKQGVQGTCSSPVVVVKFKAMWIYRSQLVFRSKQTPPPNRIQFFLESRICTYEQSITAIQIISFLNPSFPFCIF